MKAMGIDFGLARIGLSLSDDTKFLASPFETYKRKDENSDIEHILKIVQDNNVDEIVCGIPFNMQGEEQEIAKKTREFMQKLTKNLQIDVEFVDERLSSVVADEMLKNTEKDWKKRKEKLDAVAASVILQDYLDERR
ncbi:MAG: Holliday junction resolvase RuvX [Candidatus Onthoplasma sp.]